MALTPGTRLGVYQVTEQIGAGGMGEVYRATDSNLKRSVAIKVLPTVLAGDPDRLARFQREAEVLAALNHPNIAAIYGLEKTTDFTALVMELVEGEDLAQRIARGAIPIDEALPIAKQIADALEAAHEQGIIHRDLKPANIKVRVDGTVKVLDFGLAKALEATSGMSANAMNSPTITTPAMTLKGVILGTAAYMAPEQAKGKTVDRRADIWAFGVVFYEMLTGERAFTGEDVSETLASVLKDSPSFDALPAWTPPRLTRLLKRCLDRDVKTRLRDIGEARVEIAGIIANVSDIVMVSAVSPETPPLSVIARVLPWIVAGGFGVALLAALLLWAPWRSVPLPIPLSLLASIGADASLPTNALGASAILSPDGTTLAFVAQQTGGTRLFFRKLDRLQAEPLSGTAGASGPFFSPDGQWIAFFADGKLKKVSVNGGAAITLCDAPLVRGGTWTDDDAVVFMAARKGALMRVPSTGGTPTAFGMLSTGAVTQRWPQALPGGRLVLYTEHSVDGNFDGANLVVAPLTNGTPKVVVHGGYYGRYVPSGRGASSERQVGHLVYMQQGTLFAVPFNLDRLETVGRAVPALEGVAATPADGAGQLAFSSEGTLLYVTGAGARTAIPMNWMTRDGRTSALRATKVNWAYPRFSPDGQKLALQIFEGKQWDIWVYEWARDTLTQVTFDPGSDRIPVWTPDGRRIVFESDRAKLGIQNLYWVNADGTGDVTRLTDSSEHQFAFSWHPSGRFLAYMVNFDDRSDLMILQMEGDAVHGWTPGKPTVFLTTPGVVYAYPMFSPDGRWIAYRSNEASNDDIYVRPFPGPGGKWRVSTQGGTLPLWSAAAHELLFVDPTQNKIMMAPYTVVGDAFRAEKPQVWSPTSLTLLGGSSDYPYDLHPDGKRLAITPPPDSSVQDKVVFVFNFADYLRKIAPAAK